MASLVIPPFVTERHGLGPFTHCVACSTLMAVNGLHPGLAPSTWTEADALYKASHPYVGGGESVEAVTRAAQARYGIGKVTIHAADEGFRALWDALTPGHAAVLIGRPMNLPTSSILRLYVGLKFDGQHCEYVQRRDERAEVWTLDPMGPATGYRGNTVQAADLAKFYTGSAAIYAIASA